MNVQHFKAKPELGYFADFYLYVSPNAERIAQEGGKLTFLIQPNNSGTNSDDPKVHQKDAYWMGFGRHFLADDLGVVLLVPAFVRPSKDWKIYTHALDRDVFTTKRNDLYRLDLQLIAMINESRRVLRSKGFFTNKKILIQGFSASAMFANRFATLHPSMIMAVASGSPGGWPIAPIKKYKNESLPYPSGISDIYQLTDQRFDSINYQKMPQLIFMGSLDDNDSLNFSDGWEKENSSRVKRLFGPTPVSRWRSSIQLYKLANANVHFELVDNIGHDRKALQYLTTDFFKKILMNHKN